MAPRRLIWQLFPAYLLIMLAAIGCGAWLASRALEDLFLRSLEDDLLKRAQIVETLLGPVIDANRRDQIQRLVDDVARASDTRLSVILPEGVVIADSHDPPPIDSHLDRPELREALAGRIGIARRESSTSNEAMQYVALPVYRQERVAAIVRCSVPVAYIARHTSGIHWTIWAGGSTIALLAAAVGLWVSHRISRPVERLRAGAERFARGDLSHRLPIPNNTELGRLAETLNKMAEQLQERIQTLARQSNEQEAVLASMVEGVLAVDTEERIISINEVAAELVAGRSHEIVGRSLQEVVRNVDLRQLVGEALASMRPVEADVMLRGPVDRVLQARGTALRDAAGHEIGAVIVLNDVTDLRRLESMRSDFVANVSHELRTPITSIKGFIETLLDGALDSRQDAERFLRIMARQADRLSGIIEDLLSLSKIEQSDRDDIPMSETRIAEVVEAAAYDCQKPAAERNIEVVVACPSDLTASINPPLMEQALVNLLDNAIKYSEEGRRVEIHATRSDGQIVIAVRDHGCGIPEAEMARIFERFYRVDKGRSRKLGGTGLGLSIVKHIVNAHRGNVDVASSLGEGSTFTIRLPAQ